MLFFNAKAGDTWAIFLNIFLKIAKHDEVFTPADEDGRCANDLLPMNGDTLLT